MKTILTALSAMLIVFAMGTMAMAAPTDGGIKDDRMSNDGASQSQPRQPGMPDTSTNPTADKTGYEYSRPQFNNNGMPGVQSPSAVRDHSTVRDLSTPGGTVSPGMTPDRR